MWDGNPFESKPFSIEGAGEGFSSFPDSYYHQEHRLKPEPLKSMTPRKEVSAFCSDRGDILFFNHRFREAIPAFVAACAWLHPNVPNRLRYMLTMVYALDGMHIPNRDQEFVEDVRFLCKAHGISFKQFVSPTHTHFRVKSPLMKEVAHV